MALGDLLNVMCPDDDVSIFTVGRLKGSRCEKLGVGAVGDLRDELANRYLDMEVVHVTCFADGLMILVER